MSDNWSLRDGSVSDLKRLLPDKILQESLLWQRMVAGPALLGPVIWHVFETIQSPPQADRSGLAASQGKFHYGILLRRVYEQVIFVGQ
ncbi:MAG TPA: hypothetical protein VG848_02835 [Acetobacteraceae bacterium]|jgi:hypothetical protein|nr:hypothetical protein [Acetobacteraceae bacterium]